VVPARLPAPLSVPSSTTSDAVMLQFQQLMKQVLQTQTTIMTAYLQGAPAGQVSVAATAARRRLSLPSPASHHR
jgi:hypothetical protein